MDLNQQYRHKKLISCRSINVAEMPKISRARKVSTEADIVVSFVKSRNYIPCSINFEKKFYLKRNSDIVEQRMCYNTRFDVADKKEFLKVMRLVADSDPTFLEKAIEHGCVNEAPCTSFVKSNLVNVISVTGKDLLGEPEINNFILKNISYDAYGHKYTQQDNVKQQTTSQQKIKTIKNIISRKSGGEKKIGDLYFEYINEKNRNVSFYIIMQCFENQCNLKKNTKQRVKKTLAKCVQDIRRYNLPVPLCQDGQVTHENHFQELLTLDIINWKVLDYKFKSSKDESFYKRIRRRNRALTEV